ncbi:hypothetical protein [Saccharopolyspora rosea]|uniref:Uncharacterized protein n=1 Tax=Saccharopolyspora rosea TaxID=524884 RepID=A0ABW3G0G2_9PSEU|nr:hypothetical protein [Saccharopolyspora rosea]
MTWSDVDDDDLGELVRELCSHGYRPRPLPLPGVDVLLSRYQAGFVDVLVLSAFGDAVMARYEAVYDLARPLTHRGRQLWREELPPREAVVKALRAIDPVPAMCGGVLEPTLTTPASTPPDPSPR